MSLFHCAPQDLTYPSHLQHNQILEDEKEYLSKIWWTGHRVLLSGSAWIGLFTLAAGLVQFIGEAFSAKHVPLEAEVYLFRRLQHQILDMPLPLLHDSLFLSQSKSTRIYGLSLKYELQSQNISDFENSYLSVISHGPFKFLKYFIIYSFQITVISDFISI